MEIYRTTNGGTTSYRVGSVTNGTTTFTDSVSDADLVLNSVLYTDGGVLEHDQPPPSKYISVANNTACYSHPKIGTETDPTGFILSVPGNPDAVPGSFLEHVESDITGASSVGKYHLLFARDSVWRVEGVFDELGRGAVEAVEISRQKGCVSHNSIVKIPATGFSGEGVVFAGVDGFYFSDGYDVRQISTHLVPSYSNIVSATANEPKIYGRYDAKENRVHWSCYDTSITGDDNNRTFILDLNFQPVAPIDRDWETILE